MATLPVPEGYSSWLDYAVENFDTRQLALDGLFGEEDLYADRVAVRDAARRELHALREQAQAAAAAGG